MDLAAPTPHRQPRRECRREPIVFSTRFVAENRYLSGVCSIFSFLANQNASLTSRTYVKSHSLSNVNHLLTNSISNCAVKPSDYSTWSLLPSLENPCRRQRFSSLGFQITSYCCILFIASLQREQSKDSARIGSMEYSK